MADTQWETLTPSGWRPSAGERQVSPQNFDPSTARPDIAFDASSAVPDTKWKPPAGDRRVGDDGWETIVPGQSSPYSQFMRDQGQSFSLKPFADAGYSPAAIEGIRRNVMRESKGDPNAIGDKGSSFGLFQLHNTRWDDLKHWAAANKLNWQDPDTQVRFSLQELQSKYPALAKQLMSAKSADEAEQLFKDIYERPAGTKLTAGERFLMGATDPVVGGGQLLGKMTEAPNGYTQADVDLINKGLIAAGLPPTASVSGDLDRAVKEREITYQDRRGANQGADWWRIGGNVAGTLPFAAVGGPATSGALVGATQPVTSDDYWTQKAEDVGLGAAGGKAAGVVGNALARFVGPTAGRLTNSAVQDARDAGYVLPPAMMPENSGIATDLLAGWAGKAKTAQAASVKNQEVTNKLAAESLGLPGNTSLTEKTFNDVRANAGKAYQAVEQSGVKIEQDSTFFDDLLAMEKSADEARAAFPGIVRNDEINRLVDELGTGADFSPKAGIQTIRRLRSDAAANLKNFADPRKVELGFAQRDAANALEELIERNLQRAGKGDLMDEFRSARQMIAKSHDLESATNSATGDVSARKLAALKNRGRPLSGNLDKIADTANAFPKATQSPAQFGGAEPLSVLDVAGAGLSALHGRPDIAAAFIGRPLARSLVLSRPYQNMLAPQSRTLPSTAPRLSPQTRNVLAEILRRAGQYSAPAGAALAQSAVGG